MTFQEIAKRHSTLIYFILAFAIPWGTVLLVARSTGLPATEPPSLSLFSLAFLSMIAGPCLTSLALTGIIDGKEGLRNLLARQTRWRVGASWWAASLFLIPVILIIIVFLLSLISPIFSLGILSAEDKIYFLTFGITGGCLAGFVEEVGWTGFALPRMQARYGTLSAALVLGLLHGGWHFLGDFWGNGAGFGSLYLARIFLWIATVTALRFLISWIYNNTGSLLLAQVMHASSTGGQALLEPRVAPPEYVMYLGFFALTVWIVVLAIVGIYGKTLRRTH